MSAASTWGDVDDVVTDVVELDVLVVVVDDSDVSDSDDDVGCDAVAAAAAVVVRCRSVVPGEVVLCVVAEEEGEGQATTSTSFRPAVMVSTFGGVSDALSETRCDVGGWAGTERPWGLAEFVLFWDISPSVLNNDLLAVEVVVVVVVDGFVKVGLDAEDEVDCFDWEAAVKLAELEATVAGFETGAEVVILALVVGMAAGTVGKAGMKGKENGIAFAAEVFELSVTPGWGKG